jgi:hypothetical protein
MGPDPGFIIGMVGLWLVLICVMVAIAVSINNMLGIPRLIGSASTYLEAKAQESSADETFKKAARQLGMTEETLRTMAAEGRVSIQGVTADVTEQTATQRNAPAGRAHQCGNPWGAFIKEITQRPNR